MKLGIETETLEYKKSTGELKAACVSICAMLNKHQVGTLYFGVKPNGEVLGQTVNESSLRDVSRTIYEAIRPQIFPSVQKDILDGRDVIRVEFNGTDIPYSAFGKYYIRTADEDREISPAELQNLFIRKTQTDQWETQDSGVSITHIDKAQLRNFYEAGTQAGRLPKSAFKVQSLINKLGLTAGENLNNAGNILFGNSKPLRLKLAVFATNEKLTFIDMKMEEGNLHDLLDVGEQYIMKNIHWRVEIDSMERKEIPEIPVAVIRELLSNSFAHALYHANTVHEICVHPGMVTIYNPGSFANPYKPSDYVRKNLPSVLRNELIAKTLYIEKRIEEFGSGLKRIDALCKNAGIKYLFENSSLGFKAVIYRSNSNKYPIIAKGNSDKTAEQQFLKYQNDTLNDTLNGQNDTLNDTLNAQSDTLNDTLEKRIIGYLRENPELTQNEIHEISGKSITTVKRAMRNLIETGYLIRLGGKKNGCWVISVPTTSDRTAVLGVNSKPRPRPPQDSSELHTDTGNVSNDELTGELNGELNIPILSEREQKVFQAIESDPLLSRAALVEKLAIPARTFDRIIKKLIDERMIVRVGAKKTGHWEVRKKN